jgi:magnesium transporter
MSSTADGRLVGVLSLRDLIVAPPSTSIGDVMIDEPVAVDVLADHDHVAGLVARYNLLAVPVVDADRKLVGIVTVDDAIDTILPANRPPARDPRRDRSQG